MAVCRGELAARAGHRGGRVAGKVPRPGGAERGLWRAPRERRAKGADGERGARIFERIHFLTEKWR